MVSMSDDDDDELQGGGVEGLVWVISKDSMEYFVQLT